MPVTSAPINVTLFMAAREPLFLLYRVCNICAWSTTQDYDCFAGLPFKLLRECQEATDDLSAADMDFDSYRSAITEADGETIVPTSEVGPRIDGFDPNTKDQKAALDKTPVHCLPIEILRQIFIRVPAVEFRCSLMPLWTSASQVCSLWRRITLETPEFWTFIPLQTRHIHWTDLCLARSRGLPLSLNISASFSHFKWYRRAVLHMAPAVSRAREIHIDTTNDDDDEQIELLQQLVDAIGVHPAPFLEVFECEYRSIVVPRFGGEIPSHLRRVTLIDCSVDQNWAGFRAPLTYLELEECFLPGIREVLRLLPSLQTLIFRGPYNFGGLFLQGAAPARAILPRLHEFNFLHVDCHSLPAFLHDVRIPSDAKFSFDIFEELTETVVISTMTSLTQTFSDHFHKAIDAGSSFQKIHIGCPDEHGLSVAFRISNPTPGSGGQSELFLPDQISYKISSIVSLPHSARSILPLLSIFGPLVQTSRTLDVDHPKMTHLEEWLDVARRIGKATSHINVRGYVAHGLVMALASTGSEPAFPHLDVLSIEDVVFADLVDDRPEPREFYWEPLQGARIFPEDGVPFIDGLLQALDIRAEMGHPIRRLTIANCTLAADMVASLRDSPGVGSVEWDGRVTGAKL